jgi:hypothetical protein
VKLFERKRLESSMNSKQRNLSSGERSSFSSLPGTIVRLVLTTQRNFPMNEQRLLLNEDLLPGHVAVNNLVRRQLKLGVKSAVQITKVHHKPSTLLGLVLNPFGEGSKKVKPSMGDVKQYNQFVGWRYKIRLEVQSKLGVFLPFVHVVILKISYFERITFVHQYRDQSLCLVRVFVPYYVLFCFVVFQVFFRIQQHQ